jgi:hypothetical protein
MISNIGLILLAIWLIIGGIVQLAGGASLSIGTLLSILGIVAGVRVQRESVTV